jgi:hypothetical protein
MQVLVGDHSGKLAALSVPLTPKLLSGGWALTDSSTASAAESAGGAGGGCDVRCVIFGGLFDWDFPI